MNKATTLLTHPPPNPPTHPKPSDTFHIDVDEDAGDGADDDDDDDDDHGGHVHKTPKSQKTVTSPKS